MENRATRSKPHEKTNREKEVRNAVSAWSVRGGRPGVAPGARALRLIGEQLTVRLIFPALLGSSRRFEVGRIANRLLRGKGASGNGPSRPAFPKIKIWRDPG